MKSTDRPDIKSLQSIRDYASRLRRLHTLWKPYPGQVEAGKLLFNPQLKKKIVMLQCGRKWGKTEFGIYCGWRYALMHPKSAVYIIYPERSQASEVIWDNRRLQDFGPPEFKVESDSGENKSELRIRFKNGSFIKLEGSENYNRLRGYTPDFVVYDEYKDHHPQAHVSMKPNLVAKGAQLLIIGTPPDKGNHYIEMREWLLEEVASDNIRYAYREAPSWENPDPVIQEEIKEERRIAEKRGKMAEFEREFGARYIPGGASAVFPQFDTKRHIKSAPFLQNLIRRDKSKLGWYAIFDPGTSTCFAVLLLAHNRFTSQVYVVGEIYEKDRKRTTVGRVWPRVLEQIEEWYPRVEDWTFVYDEAAASFAEEMDDQFQIGMEPTRKKTRDKDRDIGLAKSLMAEKNRFFVNSKCEWLKHEIENYCTLDNGTYQKNDDHLIDCFRYFLAASDYKLIEEADDEETFLKYEADTPPHLISLEEDLRKESEKDRFSYDENAPYYDEDDETWVVM